MSRFYPAAGQFWLDDQPQFIQAGEFHYFRTPQDQWRHRLELLQTAGFNTLATYIPWLWHQLDEDISDFNGHSHPMRNLAGFLDLATEMRFLIIPRPGPYIMAETINEGIPPWMFKKYPQTAFISQDGKVQNIASYMHPDFLKCVKKWYQAIFEVLTPRQVTHGGRIIMIQLDNEMGMMHWVRNIIDTNQDTIVRFASYLNTFYGEHLSDRYPSKDLEVFLRDGIIKPQVGDAERILDDYRRFFRGYLLEYASYLWAEAKANGMDVPPVINIHGFMNGGKTFPIGISQLISVMEIDGMLSATDVYPGYISEGNFHQLLLINEMTKALDNKEQALFSIEFQSGGHRDFGISQSSLYDLHTRLCISSGMRAINHYLFFGGENDPILSPTRRHDWGPPVRMDGTLRKHYFRYPKLSKVLKSYGTDLTLSQPKNVTTIGFLLDYFMTEVNNEFTREQTNIITHQREVVLFDMIGRGLTLTHRPFNTIEIVKGDLNLTIMPTLWVMMDKQCDAGTQQKLVDYVHSGGKLIIAGRMCIEEFDHHPCTILMDAIGINHIQSDAAFIEKYIRVFEYKDVPVKFLETYTGDFDEVFARNEEDGVVGFCEAIGLGSVTMFGAAMYTETREDINIVHQLALKAGCPPLFTLNDWADVRISCGEKGDFLFVNNYQDDPVETTIKYEQELLFGGKSLSLPARRGLIVPLEWQMNDNVTIHYLTTEVTEIKDAGLMIRIDLAQEEFYAELSLVGYHFAHAVKMLKPSQNDRVRVHGRRGFIELIKDEK